MIYILDCPDDEHLAVEYHGRLTPEIRAGLDALGFEKTARDGRGRQVGDWELRVAEPSNASLKWTTLSGDKAGAELSNEHPCANVDDF